MLKKKDKVMPIRIEADLHLRIKEVADNQGLSLSVFMRGVIENICAQHDAQLARRKQYLDSRASKVR